MSNYQSFRPPPEQQYDGYPIQEQSQRIQSYPPALPNEHFLNLNQETQFAAEQGNRYKKTKRIKLSEGNFIIECPVPSKLLSIVPKQDDKEFTHMRYTACTCDPDNFRENKYTLRQQFYEESRKTELFIAITMYNENEVLFARTFHSVVKNIVQLCSRGQRTRTWGKDGWKKVVICIVSDGRKEINQNVLAYLAVIGVYQDGIAKNKVNDKDVTAHIYEYTTQISISSEIQLKDASEGIVPIQVIFCLKEKQAKKINSHRWFFNAFGPILNPNVCILLDVGTKPGNNSIYHLWKAFDLNLNIAGACGEIVAMKGNRGVNLINPIVAAQNFEYKMSNILDKPLESIFGYITVLPGAFSAYRYKALQNNHDGKGPLASYFLGEFQRGDADIFTANMYLAEDRILCFELVVKRNDSWVLHYVKSSYAETDVPDTIHEFISQRRRWLNGSFFAGVYAICHTFSIWRSSHNFLRKILLHIEMVYQAFNLIFSWFALGNFFLTFYIISKSLTQPDVAEGLWDVKIGKIIFEILQYVYLSTLLVQLLLAMGNRPRDSKATYIFSITFYAGLMLYLLLATGWIAYKGVSQDIMKKHFDINGFISNKLTLWNIILSIASTYGIYIISSLLFLEPWHLLTSSMQYLLLIPFYINILHVYAFCNIHDVSWGTKDGTPVEHDLGMIKATEKGEVEVELSDEQEDINTAYEAAKHKLMHHKEDKRQLKPDKYKSFRTRLVFFWLFSNAILVIGITNGDEALNFVPLSPQERCNYYMLAVFWFMTGISVFRFIGSFMFLLFRLFTD
ncbi:hypothetical protein RclHR1_07140017 [Rhizophagus clarus]|uniref:Chitin synthase n=1 Tax=Rhizophagus clarus TaxID=94130 RepID=A0A2Z6SB28_9GLOM|nr:hypothetical protein RclHR1_07140017 [Rhizophagus clarus]GES73611.1 glycosyltransferase family 2 protein [Rhizophagus clarus]